MTSVEKEEGFFTKAKNQVKKHKKGLIAAAIGALGVVTLAAIGKKKCSLDDEDEFETESISGEEE